VKLFIVTRWGSDDPPDYADGPDTNFLVRANDYLEAVSLVDNELERLPHKHARPLANVVTELGLDCGTVHKTEILAGPFLQFVRFSGYREVTWIRDPQLEASSWQRCVDRLRE
jgi:hypothetical protein